MFYYTLYIDMDAPQYVHADVPSNALVSCVFYYTLHIDMATPQYAHVDVI